MRGRTPEGSTGASAGAATLILATTAGSTAQDTACQQINVAAPHGCKMELQPVIDPVKLVT